MVTHTSPHFNIDITEEGRLRFVRFVTPTANIPQSCIDITQPKRLVLDYTRNMLAGLLVAPTPRRVLLIGMGAGTLPRALQHLCPDVHITSVEIDPVVVDLAARYFSFTAGPQQVIQVAEGREWIQRARNDPRRYDMILLDAYDVDYIPDHMVTREFLAETRSLLGDGGVVVANTFAKSKRYDSESVTYAGSFDWMLNFKPPEGNRIVVAGEGTAPMDTTLKANAAMLESGHDLDVLGVDFDAILGILGRQPDWNHGAPVLSDQNTNRTLSIR